MRSMQLCSSLDYVLTILLTEAVHVVLVAQQLPVSVVVVVGHEGASRASEELGAVRWSSVKRLNLSLKCLFSPLNVSV